MRIRIQLKILMRIQIQIRGGGEGVGMPKMRIPPGKILGTPLVRPTCVGNLSPVMAARNQVGIGMSYWPVSLCSLATQFQTRFMKSILRLIAGLKFRFCSIFEQKEPWTEPQVKLSLVRIIYLKFSATVIHTIQFT